MIGKRSRISAILLTACVLLALAAGCSSLIGTPAPTAPPPTTTPQPIITPTPPAGWSIHQGDHFQLALPPGWQELPLDDAGLKKLIDSASTSNPHLADQLNGIVSSGQNKSFIFFAADTTPGPIVANLSLSRTTIPAGTSVDQAVRDFADSLPQLLKGGKLISFDVPMELNGQKAGEIVYDLPLVNPAGQVVTVRGVQFLIAPRSGAPYVLAITGDAADADKFMPLARQIGSSFLDFQQ